MSQFSSANGLKPRFAIALVLITLTTGFLTAACQNTSNSGGGSGTAQNTANSGGGSSAADSNTLKIVSSLPMTGSSLGQTQTIVNGIKQVIEENNSTACDGKLKLEYEAMDDATAAAGKWDPAQETENANKAVADKNVVAYIGTFNSGAAKLAIPILNQADLVMISPANTYPGLTKPGKGEGNEPNIYYPNGKRNFTRVVPADDLQGVVAAKWAKSLGVKKAYILDDQ